jgi:hypothetical protein
MNNTIPSSCSKAGIVIEPATMDRAYEAFHRRYVLKTKAWDLDHHAQLWVEAQRAVEACDVSAFESVYGSLRKYWQLTRGRDAKMATPAEVFKGLCALAPRLRKRRLAELSETDLSSLLATVEGLKSVKQTKGGTSIMAVSKVLHFFNPRLFVIVDRAMVWNFALNHLWLWRPIEAVRDALDRSLHGRVKKHPADACDPTSYVAVLLWSGELIQANPAVTARFAEYLRRHCRPHSLPDDLMTYEAVAVEWLLLGLVELPPPGVAAC